MTPDIEAMLTIEPEPRSSIALPTSRQHQNTPVRFTEMTASHSSSGTSSEGILWTIPALLTRTSMRPCSSSTVPTISRTEAGFVTSVCTKVPSSSSATSGPVWSLTSAMTISAPARRRAREIASPRLCPPPVTTATLSRNEKPCSSISSPLSKQRIAPIHDEDRAGHEAGSLARQVDDTRSQLLGCGVALHGGVLDPMPPEPWLVHGRHGRLDVAGSEGVDPHVVWRPLRSQGFGQLVDGGFGSVVGRLPLRAVDDHR